MRVPLSPESILLRSAHLIHNLGLSHTLIDFGTLKEPGLWQTSNLWASCGRLSHVTLAKSAKRIIGPPRPHQPHHISPSANQQTKSQL